MPDVWQKLVDDLYQERKANQALLETVDAAAWDNPSPAEGWLLRDCVVHLAETDDTATRNVEDRDKPPAAPTGRRGRRPDGVLTTAMVSWRRRDPADVLNWYRDANDRLIAALRTLAGNERLRWAGREMSALSFTSARLMEHWSHGLDIHDAARAESKDTDRLESIVRLGYATRDFAYRNHGLEPPDTPLRVEVTSPTGATWTHGPEDAPDRITGPAGDFARIVTQRIHPTDTALTATGPHAAEFLTIAQAFAGPSGPGRPPKGTPAD
jgi:uncharacterized protein (TIGR03084 family)